jgi:hypothetical protein
MDKKKGMYDSLQRISFEQPISSFSKLLLKDAIPTTPFLLSISLTHTH